MFYETIIISEKKNAEKDDKRNEIIKVSSELGTFEWWISGLMLDPLFFLISRLNMKSFIAKYFELKPKAGVCYKTLMFKIIPSVEEKTKILKIYQSAFQNLFKEKNSIFYIFSLLFCLVLLNNPKL